MQLYIYAKSGHNFGLENIRRASALFKALKQSNPILCSADYRAATFAKEYLGVDKGVGVDVIGNMPNVMERGDMLIYDDSGEASLTMQEHMQEFCQVLYKVGDHIPFDVVDDTFYEKGNQSIPKAIFFADDDYNEWFLKFLETGTKKDIPFIWGHYFFFKNESKFSEYFNEVIEEEGYQDTIKNTKYLLTASVHAALESLASGNFPVFFQRGDKEAANFDLIEKYNIPVIQGDSFDTLFDNFESCILQYPQVKSIEKVDISKIQGEIEMILKKFEMIKPSLEYKF
jgi:hypothetical protein